MIFNQKSLQSMFVWNSLKFLGDHSKYTEFVNLSQATEIIQGAPGWLLILISGL